MTHTAPHIHVHTIGGEAREREAQRLLDRLAALGWTDVTWVQNNDPGDPWWHAAGCIAGRRVTGQSPHGPDGALYDLYTAALEDRE